MNDQKSYFAVIPASVRYHEKLCANAKLLYGEISALCNEKGFCWATNEYFMNLYKKSEKTVSRWVNQLKNYKFVNVEIVFNSKEKINRRKIWLDKNVYDTWTKMSDESEKDIDKNVQYNNTVNTNSNNKKNTNTIQRKTKRKPKKVKISSSLEILFSTDSRLKEIEEDKEYKKIWLRIHETCLKYLAEHDDEDKIKTDHPYLYKKKDRINIEKLLDVFSEEEIEDYTDWWCEEKSYKCNFFNLGFFNYFFDDYKKPKKKTTKKKQTVKTEDEKKLRDNGQWMTNNEWVERQLKQFERTFEKNIELFSSWFKNDNEQIQNFLINGNRGKFNDTTIDKLKKCVEDKLLIKSKNQYIINKDVKIFYENKKQRVIKKALGES